MADFAFQRSTRVQAAEAGQIFVSGQEAAFIFGQGTQIFPNLPVELWGSALSRITVDATGHWFEFGFRIDCELSGNAAAGWTDPGDYLRLQAQYSTDLVTWEMGKFLPAPTPVIDRLDGSWEYWSRATVPRRWNTVLVDLTAGSTRHGKSITAIKALGVTLSLPGYPYAMPAAAANLQADLRAAGYTDATVTTTAAALTVEAVNWRTGGPDIFTTVWSGSTVTAVKLGASTLSLPGYPYALPADAATLQADIRAAGYSGTVVTLHADAWEIFLPARPATAAVRDFTLTLSPSWQVPTFDIVGGFLGLVTAATEAGSFSNVRTPAGDPLQEADRAFARLSIEGGSRYDPFLAP